MFFLRVPGSNDMYKVLCKVRCVERLIPGRLIPGQLLSFASIPSSPRNARTAAPSPAQRPSPQPNLGSECKAQSSKPRGTDGGQDLGLGRGRQSGGPRVAEARSPLVTASASTGQQRAREPSRWQGTRLFCFWGPDATQLENVCAVFSKSVFSPFN